MPLIRSAEPLLSYTDWLRTQWQSHLSAKAELLSSSVGAHSDGRFGTIGEVIRHVFGAELRYVDRIRGEEASDVSHVAPDSVDALFELGGESRASLRRLLEDFGEEDWEEERLFPIGAFEFEGTSWKILTHVLVHEIRHWAQVGTLLRLNGNGPALHDFLVSPVLGGEFRRRG